MNTESLTSFTREPKATRKALISTVEGKELLVRMRFPQSNKLGISKPLVVGTFLICVGLPSVLGQERKPTKIQSKELPNLGRVNEKLYRGAQPGKGGIHRLALLGVNTIINLRAEDERSSSESAEAKKEGLQYLNIPYKRLGRPTDSQIEKVLSLIDAPENGVVFVHCHHGSDRTGIVVAIYRITHDGWTVEDAKREAESFGMKIWQRGMKDYISDYYRDRTNQRKSKASGLPPDGKASATKLDQKFKILI